MYANLCGVVIMLTAAAGDGPKQAYPGGNLLIEASDLAAQSKDFRILDVRPKTAFDRGHVAGAIRVDPLTWAKDFANGQDPGAWATTIGKLGITQDTAVVLYDDSKSKDAARVWYILRYFGLKDARLLNGGWSAWQKAGLPESVETSVSAAREFVPAANTGRLATKEGILKLLKEPQQPQIIDARSEAEHCGIEKLAKRGGAIPGSLHLEWSDAIDSKTQKFKNAAELARLFKNAGIDINKPAITYCQSGGRAAVMAFTLELMGARDVANYYRSWAEWGSSDELPIETPKRK